MHLTSSISPNLIKDFVFTSLVFLLMMCSCIAQDYHKILEQARLKNDYRALADTYLEIGLNEEENGHDLGKAFDYISRAIEYGELLKDTAHVNTCKYHIARYFLENEMYEDAIEEFKKVKKYFVKKGDNEMVVWSELNLFNAYKETYDLDLARASLDKVAGQKELGTNADLRINYLINKIQYHQALREIDSSLYLANLCFDEKFNGKILYQYTCLAHRGDVYLAKRDYPLAIEDYSNALQFFERQAYSKTRLRLYENMAKALYNSDDMQEAYSYKEKYQQLQDSIFTESRTIALNNRALKHQSEKKSLEISMLELENTMAEESNKQQKRALFVLGSLLALMLVGIYYIVGFYKEKINTASIIEEQNQKINQQRIKELQDQIQINSMQSMLTGQEVERERISKDLHDSLGGLLSAIKLQVDKIRSKGVKDNLKNDFQSATKLLDNAVSEVRSISQNLQPAALSRLGLVPALKDLINRYQSESGPEIIFQEFDMPKKLDQMKALGIFRIIQEILNNAIKHAQAKEVLVQLNGEDDDIIILVEDDGIGFDTDKKYKSMGLENIKSRVNYLKGTIDIDSRIGEGTTYLIHVKWKS